MPSSPRRTRGRKIGRAALRARDLEERAQLKADARSTAKRSRSSPISKRKKKIPWPAGAETAHRMTRNALGKQRESCQTHQVIQYYNTCWIASVVFVVYNNKALWNLMSPKVQKYVLKYFKDPGAATSVYNSYDLRNEEETTDQCRMIPKQISKFLDIDELTSSGGYMRSDTGGIAHEFFDAICLASDLKPSILHIHPQGRKKKIHEIEDRFSDIVRVRCWCPQVPLFSSKLSQLCDLAINLLYGFECVGGMVAVQRHIMGFVRCRNGLDTRYSDDFFLSQSYHFSSGTRVSQLVHARPGADFRFFDLQKTRTTTDSIFEVTFFFTRIPGMSRKAQEVTDTYKRDTCNRINLLQGYLKHMQGMQ